MSDPFLQAHDEKRTALTIKELEDRHQRYDALILTAESAASHALTNNAVREGSAYDYKLQIATTPDGSKHNSLPTVSEDTSYSAPLSSAPSVGHLSTRSFKGSSSALNLDGSSYLNLDSSTSNSINRRPLKQEVLTAGTAFLHALISMTRCYIIVSSS